MKIKKVISIFVLAITLISTFSINVFAEPTVNSKEEIVYVILKSDGKPKDVFIVNSYADLNANLNDYGDYSAIRNLTTKDELTFKDGIITSPVNKGKFYYEGKSKTHELPWNFSISYKLNEKDISPENVAGKQGNIEITIAITNNEKANKVFYENYALSISTTFDTNKCTDIIAEGAVIANAGESKALSYTLLPKSNVTYTIKTKATEFEMGAISFNAVPFSMNVAIDGIDNVTSEFKPLIDGVSKLNEGATALSKGSKELNIGVEELSKNSNDIKDGSNEILKAISAISSALSSMGNLSGENSDLTSLNTAMENYKNGLLDIQTNLKKIATDDEQTKQLLSALLTNSDPMVQQLLQLYMGKMGALSKTTEGMSSLIENFALIQGGVSNLTSSVTEISKLSEALGTLLEQYKGFNSGIKEYTNGVLKISSSYKEINNGIIELKKGITALNDSTKNLDTEINKKIDTALSAVGGGDFTLVSFANEKNTNIESVQFVVKSDAIKTTEKLVENVEKPIKTGFWEKFLNLFRKKA